MRHNAAPSQRAREINAYAHTKRDRFFTVPAGTGGIDRDCHEARKSDKACHCGCFVRYNDGHGSWCLACGA